MKAITCPQCGSLIKNVLSGQTIVECEYCGAMVVTDEKLAPTDASDWEAAKFRALEPDVRPSAPVQPFFIAISAIGIFMFVLFLVSFLAAKKRPVAQNPPEIYKPITFPTIAPPLKIDDDDALLRFGGKGTSAGLFDGANRIAVGRDGNVYVADETLRVQRFDQTGKFTNLWNVKGTKNETIDKLAASADGDVYVLIGGEIVVYKGETGEQLRVLTDSRRHYIDDFVLRDDGGLMYIAEDGKREEFVQTSGKTIVNRFAGIHSRAADANIPAAGIKIAVGGTGEIFSVYAIMSQEGTFNYNDEDLMTFHFSKTGKFVNKFAANLMPEAISIDNQSRVYILDTDKIVVFSSSGEIVGVQTVNFADAFAVDNQNNIYTVSNNVVRKLKPIVF